MHTLNPECVHVARWAGRVVAHQAPCRGLPLDVSWPSPDRIVGLSQHTPGCVAAHAWSYRALCRARRVAAPARRVASQARPCRGLYRGPAGHIVADHARPYAPATRPGPSPRPCLPSPVSQYSLLYCDSHLEKNGQ